jgi:hypothetical protein
MSTLEQAMTRSSSSMKASRSWFILVALLLLTGVASAGRKRVVVLEFEGDKAEQFHEDVVRLIKKSHTVVSIDKWNGTAEEMSATKLTGQNVKKVAKKLKIDGVVSGTVEKRRDEYILRMKLRSGTSGELVGTQVNIKSESGKLDGTAVKDVKDELIEVIASLESNRDGGGGTAAEEEEEKPKKAAAAKKPVEEEEEKPKKSGFGKKPPAEEEEEKPKKAAAAKKPVEEEEEKPKKSGFGKKPVEEEEKPKKAAAAKKPVEEEEKPKKAAAAKKPVEEEEEVALKPKKSDEEKPKKVAAKPSEDGEEIEGGTEVSPVGAESMYSPGERAIDAVAGMSFTARRMAFSYNANQVTSRPAGYKQTVPVPGIYIDATVYPLAYGHKRKDIYRHIGATVMFDKVLGLNSKNPNDGMKLSSSEQRIAFGGVFRYPFGTAANAPVIGAALRYGQQKFTIEGTPAIPNVNYSMLDLTGFFKYTLAPKMVLDVSLGALLPLGAGDITQIEQYGRASITGFEFSGGLDYLLMKNIFARGEIRVETLGYSFKKEGMKSTGVGGARDTYYGGTLTAGFLF